MSSGSVAIPLLKAAPEQGQLADRLSDGPWKGLELCLLPGHVVDEEALGRAIGNVREGIDDLDLALTAEAPVSWPSGAFVRVDRLDAEARAGIERSARFAAAIGSQVLTIHLFTPVEPALHRAGFSPAPEEIERFLRYYTETCLAHGVRPLIENVPPVLRMRVGGVYLSPVGGHWRDLLEWCERVPGLGVTLDVSHAALFRSFAAAYPTPFGLASSENLEIERFVEELGPVTEVAHVSDARGVLGEGLPYGEGEIDLDPVVSRLGALVPFIVAEINEPDTSTSGAMKAGYRAIERAMGDGRERLRPPPPRSRADRFDWQTVAGRRDPFPAVLELQERFEGRRVLITGGCGSLGRVLATFLQGFRPAQITLLDAHEASIVADLRARDRETQGQFSHVLCDVRDSARLQSELARAQPDVLFHFAAYKHVDRAEQFPEEYVDVNLHGTWNVLQGADACGVGCVVVASTDKAALAASLYARTKRLMEQLTAFTAQAGAERRAVRFVNVLGSAGSASELFLEQARSGLPLTVTNGEMMRYWITKSHAVTLAAHATLGSARDTVLLPAGDTPLLSVGELAKRIWRQAGCTGEPQLELLGIRAGETMEEVLTGPGEVLGSEIYPGACAIQGAIPTGAAAWAVERLPGISSRETARPVWLEALRHPGLTGRAPSYS